MYEHESDILIAEPEEETQQIKQEQPKINTNDNSNNLVEFFYKPQKAQESKQTKPEEPKFTNYSNSHLNKVYKKYDVVQTYVPKKEKQQQSTEFEKFVTEQNNFTPQQETFTVQTPSQKPSFRLTKKAKTWLVCVSVIIVMLSSLCIINAVNINNLNSSINQTQSSITNINKNIQNTIKDIGKLTDEQEIKNNASDLGLTEVEPKNNIEIQLNEKNVVEDYQGQTNFFDEICNFIRSLFGG